VPAGFRLAPRWALLLGGCALVGEVGWCDAFHGVSVMARRNRKEITRRRRIGIARMDAIHAYRADLTKPAAVRLETCRASGDKRVRYLRLPASEIGWSAR
jgi:hypothetical protein